MAQQCPVEVWVQGSLCADVQALVVQCATHGPNWGELHREIRYCQHRLEAETKKLAQFTPFVALSVQGTTKDEACAAVVGQQGETTPDEQATSGDVPAEEAPPEEGPAEPGPRLEGASAAASALCHAGAAFYQW